MKPLKLVIDGIKSFSNRVEIDFDEVSKGGLFGIFGNTGSGKSAILDSIIIALYGDLAGSKMSDIINARKKSAFVSLEFEICEKSVRKRYLVERTFKLKKDGSYGSADASLYETTSGQSVMTAHQVSPVGKEIERIIGLGQGEFTKCIILPQGEFSQFVKTTKAERTKIIEKLFSLERFGERFNVKLKSVLSDLNSQINAKKEALNQIAQVTKEDLENALNSEQELKDGFSVESEKLLKIEDYISENANYYALYNQLVSHKKEFENLKLSKSKIDASRKLVGLFERAEEIVKVGKKVDETKDELSRLTLCYEDDKKSFKEIEDSKVIVEERYKEYPILTAKKGELQAKKEEFDRAYADYIKYKNLLTAVKERKEKIENFNKEIVSVNIEIDVINGGILQYDTIRAELESKLNATDLFAFAKDKALYGEFTEQIEYYEQFIENLQDYKDDSPLYGFVTSESKSRLLHFEDKRSKITASDLTTAETAVKGYQKLQADLKDCEKKILELTAKKSACQGKLNSVTVQLKDEELLLENNLTDIRLITEKLLKIVDYIENFKKEYDFVKEELKLFEDKISDLSETYANTLKTYAEKSASLRETEAKVKTLQALVLDGEEGLKKLFDSDIPDLKTALDIKVRVVDDKTLKSEIEDFDRSFNYHQVFIEKAQAELKKVVFSIDEYTKKLEKRQEIQKNVQLFNKNLIEIKKTIENLSQNFENRCIIEKDISKLCARASVFERLDKAVERRAFSEYIAYEFLNDIANQARKTLLELTGGKYDVVYKDSVESGKIGFYILDNGNGGIERAVSTLSGGETFLVSLSLALALSASIYAGSDRPMEFFFLDEGFGTLDAELVDTVLDSLEKLRNKNFSIGLISHLSEMKSRIDRKILVTPDDGINGSSVKVII